MGRHFLAGAIVASFSALLAGGPARADDPPREKPVVLTVYSDYV
jgi:hypothetical protein